MSVPASKPTPYPDVNETLHDLLVSVQAILGDRFVGMYLYGSLALGDFAPHRSDIDFVVVTDGELCDEVFAALRAMHERIAAGDSPWAMELEGSYIPQHDIRRHERGRAQHPHIGTGGRLHVEQHDSDWIIQRHILREHGVTLAGPAPHTLIDPVSAEEVRRAVVDIVAGWWGPMLDDPTLLRHGGYQPYAVLTMCRALYTLHYSAIVSKPVAANWAQETFGGRWDTLIEGALTWRRSGDGHDMAPASPEDLGETVNLIRYTLEQCVRAYNL